MENRNLSIDYYLFKNSLHSRTLYSVQYTESTNHNFCSIDHSFESKQSQHLVRIYDINHNFYIGYDKYIVPIDFMDSISKIWFFFKTRCWEDFHLLGIFEKLSEMKEKNNNNNKTIQTNNNKN